MTIKAKLAEPICPVALDRAFETNYHRELAQRESSPHRKPPSVTLNGPSLVVVIPDKSTRLLGRQIAKAVQACFFGRWCCFY
jgi:hypothetical protein